MNPLWAGVGGLALVNVGWLTYLALIPREQVPERPTLFSLVMVVSAALAGWSVWAEQNAMTIALGSITVLLAGFFFFLLAQGPMPDGEIRVKVGEELPPFECKDASGNDFSSESLHSGRVLLKFFRGHW